MIYQEVTPIYIKSHKNSKKSIIDDSEMIIFSLVDESMSIDSEKAWIEYCKENLEELWLKLL